MRGATSNDRSLQRLLLIGFGNVGRSLAKLLVQRREALLYRCGVEFVVTGIATGSRGAIVRESGVELPWALKSAHLGPSQKTVELIRHAPADIAVELTPLDITAGEPARTHVELALREGMHVVTANKGPIAFAYRQLSQLARREQKRLLFEATVLDGTPLFNMCRYGLRGARITAVRGLVNSTTNFILGELEKGGSVEAAVREAQERGFAETDPKMDLEAWDAAAKTAVLANVFLGAELTPHKVRRTGLQNITAEDVARAAREKRRIKLVCEARWVKGKTPDSEPVVEANVAPLWLPLSDPLARVTGTSSVITLETDLMGNITIVENNPGLLQTAYGVLNDLLELVVEPVAD